mgnify:CR=1 FL=1
MNRRVLLVLAALVLSLLVAPAAGSTTQRTAPWPSQLKEDSR